MLFLLWLIIPSCRMMVVGEDNMSFVSVIAKENFITVMSDGLVYNSITGEELEQGYKKFRKISENQFIAFGGSKDLAEEVIKQIGYQQKERNLSSLAIPIREQLIKNIPPNEASCQLVLGGIEGRETIIYSFNNDIEQDLLIKKPRGGDVEYSFLSYSKNELDLDKEIKKIYPKYGLSTPTRTLKVQKALNDVVANVDPSVNRITFNLTIRK